MKKRILGILFAILMLASVFVLASCDDLLGGTDHQHEYTADVTLPTCTEQGYTTYTCSCGDTYKDNYVAKTSHTYGNWQVKREATCAISGEETRKCSNCSATETREIAKLSHDYYQFAVVISPNCTEQGYTTYSCTCGASIVSDYVPATDHSYSAVVTAPTCTEQGYTTYTCHCGYSYISDYTDPLGHDYVNGVCTRCGATDSDYHQHSYSETVIAPTCTAQGYTIYVCICGDSYTSNYTNSGGHSLGEWTVITEPTCEGYGHSQASCTVCGETMPNPLPPLGHDFVNGLCMRCGNTDPNNHKHSFSETVVAPTCTEQGYTIYTCICGDSYSSDYVPATGHNYIDGVCTECGHTEGAHEHSYASSSVQNPNCTTGGYTTYYCECGDSYTTDYTNPLGHDMVNGICTMCGYDGHEHIYDSSVIVTPPTCNEQGYTTYYCTCGASFVSDYVFATGHSYSVVVIAPTCTDQGYITYACICGDSYIHDFILPTGHIEVIDAYVAPTCTATGLTEGSHCSACNEILVAQTIVSTTDHSYTPWIVFQPSTCVISGEERRVCYNCTAYETREIVAYGHYYSSVVTAPTCTEQGYTTHICDICTDSYISDYVSAAGHNYLATIVDEPTCSVGGNMLYSCNCGDSYYEYIWPTGNHDFSGWNEYIPATCTENGQEIRMCINCGHSEYRTVEALGHSYSQMPNAPTCTQEGSTYYYCACGDSYISDYVPATGHGYSATVTAPTCTEQGYTTYTCHCGNSYTDNYISPIGHSYLEIVTAPTCTEQGYTTYTCHCGDAYIGNYIFAEHTYDDWNECVAATCIKNGEEIRICINCGHNEYRTIVALGHSYSSTVIAPTCTKEGYTAHTCHCGASYVENYTYSLGHTEVIDEGYPATFGDPGLTTGSHCSVCGIIIIAQQEIPALGSDSIVSGNDYMDNEGETYYRYSYSLTITNETEFTLTTLKIGSDETYSLEFDDGDLIELENDVYELRFHSGKESMYVKFEEGEFEFCNRDGSEWGKEKYERPEGTTEIPLTPREGNSSYGYYDLANNTHGHDMQDLYLRMFYACEAFIDNTSNIEESHGLYVIDNINLNHYRITLDEVISVWKVFLVENPRYYWLSNSLSVENGKLKLCIDEDYASADYRAACDKAIDDMAKACDDLVTDNMSDLEAALTIHNFILGQMDYAYESDGVTPEDDIWAHNMVGCAKYNLGVCESYAKTYLYLCLLNDVECLIVTGFAGEDHAWNMICINDAWYGVDVTWDETNTEEVLYTCFGMAKSYVEETHTPDSPDKFGIEYWYLLPAISERSIELVTLYENGDLVGIFENIDVAFDAMDNKSSDYAIHLQHYEAVGPLLMSVPNIEHNVNSTETPVVNSITIVGKHINSGNGYTRNIQIYFNTDIIFNSDFIFNDVDTDGEGTLYIGDFSVTFDSVYGGYICTSIIGNISDGSASEIICNEYSIEFHNRFEVYNFVGSALIRTSAKIINAHINSVLIDKSLRQSELPLIEIDNLYGDGYCNFILDCACKVTIKNVCLLSFEIVSFHFDFGSIDDFPTLELGDFNSQIYIYLEGKETTFVTDANGNEVGSYTEKCSVFDINREVAILNGTIDLYKIKIYHTLGERNVDYTYLYEINDKGELLPTRYINDNGFIVYKNILLEYIGDEKNIIIPDYIENIAQGALAETNIETVVINNAINIGQSAFLRCYNLKKVIFSDSNSAITTINSRAFAECSSLESVIIPKNAVVYGSAFADCTSLFNIFIPDSASIGYDSNYFINTAYYNDENNWKDGVLYIGNHLVEVKSNADLVDYTIKNGTVSIMAYAFQCCSNLKELVIPNSVTFIGDYAFGYCSNLTNVYYTGSKQEWNMNIYNGNYVFENVNLYYYSEAPVLDECNLWYWVDDVPTIWSTHKEETIHEIYPTCTNDGWTEGKYCSSCSEVLIAQESIPALGHMEIVFEAIDPDCITDGLTAGIGCCICGEIFVEQEIIPATGHNYIEGICTLCGHNYVPEE